MVLMERVNEAQRQSKLVRFKDLNDVTQKWCDGFLIFSN